MIRALSLVFLLGTPAFAWEARVSAVCELVHSGESGDVLVTYDTAIAEYAIAITVDPEWATAPIFAIRFDGPEGATISTDRHTLSEDGATLTVVDRGFGNLLDGLEFNVTATALLGARAEAFDLDGAAPEVRAFRACVSGPGV